jgi:hypothetical protein
VNRAAKFGWRDTDAVSVSLKLVQFSFFEHTARHNDRTLRRSHPVKTLLSETFFLVAIPHAETLADSAWLCANESESRNC